MIRNAEKSVNMGCMDTQICPTAMVPNMAELSVEDPKGQSIKKVREIRDEIQVKVNEIVVKNQNKLLD